MYHAKYIVICLTDKEDLGSEGRIQDLVARSRLGTSVKKIVLFSWLEGDDVKYKSLVRGVLTWTFLSVKFSINKNIEIAIKITFTSISSPDSTCSCMNHSFILIAARCFLLHWPDPVLSVYLAPAPSTCHITFSLIEMYLFIVLYFQVLIAATQVVFIHYHQ